MNNQLKSLSVALLALGLSMPAFAEGSVCVPSQKGGFKVGVDALYIRPTNSDLDYGTLFSFAVVNQTSTRNAFVDPAYDWGFYVQAGYLIPCTGNDLTIGYTYLKSNDTDSLVTPPSAGAPEIAVIPITPIFFPRIAFDSAQGKDEFNFNVLDLEAGQRFTTGAYDMRMFAGLRYAKIDHTLSSVGIAVIQNAVGSQQFTSNYRGLGPRIGVDGRYCLQSGFGLDANLSTSLLVGNLDGKYDASVAIAGVRAAGYNATSGSRTRIVPVLEAKLGVDYTRIIDRCNKSSLVFEAGYQVSNYFNAIDHVRVVNNFVIVSQNTTSDMGVDGLYFGVKYYA